MYSICIFIVKYVSCHPLLCVRKNRYKKSSRYKCLFVWKYVYRCLYLLISRFEESTDYYQTSLRYKSCFFICVKR